MPRFLFGPCDDATFADRFLHAPVADGRWATFSATCPSWEAVLTAHLGSMPDALLLWPGYTSVPSWLWRVPIPVVALCHDPNLLWHSYRHILPLADLVLTDTPSAERLRRAGLAHVRAANLYGLDRHFLAALDRPDDTRDLDVVFAGNINPAVQAGRGAWLGRLARLADRFSVRIASGVLGEPYRRLLRRAKLAFNHSTRGECNLRALEAAASGAVLLQEADNPEVPNYLEPNVEYACYTDDDFEAVVERLLGDEGERRAIAARARQRVRHYGYDALVEAAVGVGASDWGEVEGRARARRSSPPCVPLAGRVWLRVGVTGPDADVTLAADVAACGDRHAQALLAPSLAEAERHLAAAAPSNRVSAVGWAVALTDLGRIPEAIDQLRHVLADLEANPILSPIERDTCPYPSRFDHLRTGWERAGFDHPDDPDGENAAKVAILKCRAFSLLAARTGEIAAFESAAHVCPHIAAARAALGCALARAGRFAEAIDHLRVAVEHDPFDQPAALAFEAALARTGDEAGRTGERLRKRRLAKAAPGLVPDVEESPPAPPAPSRHRQTRFVALSRDAFAARFGTPDTAKALSGFTPPHDTAAVLALLTHHRPRRVLEIGTAAGHMTANLTAFAPADAVVFSLGVVAEDDPKSGAAAQQYEVPRRDQFAKHVNHFGTGHKAQLIVADSRGYDFARLAPLDFAFVDGGHDRATVKSDSLQAYHALRLGGCLVWHDLPSRTAWVEVEQAVAELAFPEPVYTVAGTQVAFLLKGESVGAAATAESAKVALQWDGEFEAVHSLAAVNRAIRAELTARGHDVALVGNAGRSAGSAAIDLPSERATQLPSTATVRHRWPPDFTPPPGNGPFVLMQPWEYGRIPRAWVEPILTTVDEVWVPSRSVLRAFVASGVPEDRVAVVPNGVDPDRYRPDLDPLPLSTDKTVKLLFVGGTIPRKGFDVLLTAYRSAFTRSDDVCLVVKDMGVGTFYRGQTAERAIETHRADSASPEIVYRTDELPERHLARLYAACSVLVHPYRGEGFALPVLEAMACGKPVAVTAGGPTDEFVPPSAGWKIPAQLRDFAEDKVGGMATVGRPWWLEPDPNALVALLRQIVADAGERERRGEIARRAARGWSWARTASVVEERLRLLRARKPVRFRRASATPVAQEIPSRHSTPPLSPPGTAAVTVLSDQPIFASAVPCGRPRVSLTMIVKNEEQNLPACLASVRDLVDEAVVVDTGSTDRTRDVIRSFGAVLGEFPWIDHFAAARNAALDQATGEYAFWMDADDRLDEDNRAKLRTLFAGLTGANDAYVMKCLCVSERPGAGGTVVDHVRLFRRLPAHRWTYRIHEQILPALRASRTQVGWSDVMVRHVGYIDAAVRKRKLDRDLRLLKLDEQERPHDPFTLFNLGSVYSERGDYAAAVAVLERSLAGSQPTDSIVRKLYALIAQCHARRGDKAKAAEVLKTGRGHYPEDAELLFLAAGQARERGDVRGAEALYRRLIDGREGNHFASVDASLRAVKGRHNLAVLLLEAQRESESEGLWRAALVADPHFLPAHAGLGELYAKHGNDLGVTQQMAALRELGPAEAAEAAMLEGRWHLSRKDYARAAAILEEAAKDHPLSVGVRVALSHVRLADGSPSFMVEAALRAVLALDPAQAQARHNLEVLMRNTGRWVEGIIDPPTMRGDP